MENLKQSVQELMTADNTALVYYLSMAVKVVVIIAISRIFISIINRVIGNFFNLYFKLRMDESKSTTLSGILKSLIKYVVYIIMGISILNVLNIPTAPLLATAGLGSLALGFGAQSLVKDVFTGFFILFEDQYGVGDLVTIGGMNGTVTELGLRITKLKAFSGDIYIIPNGEIKTVTNHSKGDSRAVVDVGIAYEEDAERAMAVLREVAEGYYNNNQEAIVERPEVLGIVQFNESDVLIRTIIQTKPLMHWKTERELRKLVLEAFKGQGIEIAYPKRVIISDK